MKTDDAPKPDIITRIDDALDATPPHEHPMPGLVLRTGEVRGGSKNLVAHQNPPTNDLAEATLITSECTDSLSWLGAMHRPVLDLDMPAKLIPSSTPDHFHLLIDQEMPWPVYVKLLKALAEAGVIEEGFAGASINRGFSAVRVPWVKKDKQPDNHEVAW